MKLYELSQAHRALLDAVDLGDEVLVESTGEVLPKDALGEALAALQGELELKADGCAKALASLKAEAEALEREVDRLKARAQARRVAIARIREYVSACMQHAGVRKLKTATHTLSLAKGRPSVVVEREQDLPRDYVGIEISTRPLLAEIKRAIESGADVPGARLVTGEPVLQVR